jgi:branched-subunit amino acid transport protein
MKLVALVLLMSAVTLAPRVLPFLLFGKRGSARSGGRGSADGCRERRAALRLPRRLLNRSLAMIPYAALGALIVPGAFLGSGSFSTAAAAGAAAAVVTSFLGGGLVPSVVASVAAALAVRLVTGS